MEGRIVLRPMRQGGKGHCVGTLDGDPLFIDGKTARVGDHAFQVSDLGEDLLDAVSDASDRLWGQEWQGKLAFVTGLNKRTCAPNRIVSHGLPGWVLARLGEMAATAHPRATGSMAMAAAFLLDEDADVASVMRDLVDLVSTGALTMNLERNAYLEARAAHQEIREVEEAEGVGPPTTPGP